MRDKNNSSKFSWDLNHIKILKPDVNENYDISRGGLFDGEEQYSPEFGMCVVQDMTEHDFKHGVTEVTSGERYALLSFPMLKGMKGYEN